MLYSQNCLPVTHHVLQNIAIFRDYGFIQDYPQTWLLDDCGFEIDFVDPGSILKEETSRFTVEGKDVQVTWITPLPQKGDFRNELIKYLYGLHRRVLRSKHRALNLYHPDHNLSTEEGIGDDSGSEDEEEDAVDVDVEIEHLTVPLDEWDAMLKYLEALVDAVAIAHNSLESEQDRWLNVSMIYEERFKGTEGASGDWIEAQWGKIERAVGAVNDRWMSHMASHLNAGAIAVGCALGYLDFRMPDRDWRSKGASLADWYEGFSARPSMVDTAPS